MEQYHYFDNIGASSYEGIIIPQKVYYTNAGPYQAKNPVIFPGNLTVQEALQMQFPRSPEYDVPAVTTGADVPRFSIRLNSVILWQLARRAAEAFKKFVDVRSVVISSGATTETSDSEQEHQDMHCTEPYWDLNRMPLDKIVLVELRHVSESSWQPVLSLNVD
ncbi:uncharacterized protein PHACADRAFT_31166 [Phanerochaete carnosa HHB-10118-sp]|uniref:Uncharacterized protein n=1 Tax=Phanerochaete carnosa (strain HHB-10118-sp) TaxID=650164 RepID=K5US15_PHACS|nr:uncharacterized protein PHACADRAFT_31166 [Phanerochaete carnosa HHB-10118-sp]EKM52691.1 hypothetical protein PHACADRAFT_31166 [Phanerochaete carnosa HHB-10118-sp]